MSLGTDLAFNLYQTIQPTTNLTDFPSAFSTAVSSYLSSAEYADGALTYEGVSSPAMYTLPAVGTAASAAAIIGTGVMSYWTPAGTVPGVIGIPTSEATVVAGVITASTVGPAVTASLTAIFSDLDSGQYWVDIEVSDHTSIVDTTKYDDNPGIIVANTTTNTWYGRSSNAWVEITDTKWQQIADAIESAVSGVTTAWTEITPPASAKPFTGGIA